MRPIEEQVILITGATDGLGLALARDLAGRRATVLLHGRNRERLAAAARSVQAVTGGALPRTYLGDFVSLQAVRALARDIERDQDRLDVLVNNAAIGPGPRGAAREESAEGYELRFAVNYLAPFLLTNLLLPLLRRSVPARVVNVASGGQAPIDYDDVMLQRGYDGMRAYGQSKLALIGFTFELAERLAHQGEHGLATNALHPASLMNTKMVFEYFGRALSTVEDGLESTLRVVLAPALDGVSGRYFDCLQEGRADPQAYEPAARRRLWRLSEELVGLPPSDRPANEDRDA